MPEQTGDHQRRRQLSPRARLLLATGAILVLVPSLGLVSSIAYIKARRAGLVSPWRAMGSPPGNAVEILTGDNGVVYVRTATGSVYGCEHSGWRVAEDCWHPAHEPLSIQRRAKIDTWVFEGQVRPPPGAVVDALDVTLWYGDAAFETRYRLLEDGTVWKWQYDVFPFWGLGAMLIGSIGGLVLGIVIVAVLWVRAGLRSMRQRRMRAGSPHQSV